MPRAANIMKAGLCFILSVSMWSANPPSVQAQETTLVAKGPIVIDVLGGLDWMRCSIGQVWDNGICAGSVLLIPFVSVEPVIAQVQQNIGPEWRLPSREELERLIALNPEPPMINRAAFPETYPGLYWTRDTNWLMSHAHWGVNFFTGHSYGRADGNQEFALRLVRPR